MTHSNLTHKVVIGLLGMLLLSAVGAPLPAIASAGSGRFDNWASNGTRETLLAHLPQFFGNAKGAYVDLRFVKEADLPDRDRTSLVSQFSDVFSQVPGPAFSTEGGFRVLPATRQHDATVEAFVVTLGESNTIVATALLHNHCGKYNALPEGVRAPAGPCDDIPMLSILYPGGATPNAEINSVLTSFVARQVGSRQFEGIRSTLHVEVRKLTNG